MSSRPSSAVTTDPIAHAAPSPRPMEWMRKQRVVLDPRRMQVRAQRVSARPIAPCQVWLGERAQQQLCLVEPRRVRRRNQHPHALAPAKIVRRFLARMARAAVPDQVHLRHVAMLVEQFVERRDQVVAVVLLQAPPAHRSVPDYERGGEVDRAVADVLELSALDSACLHRHSRLAAFERLQVRLLVEADEYLALLVQAVDHLVTPQHFARSLDELGVERRRLPVSRAMRLKVGRTQDERDGRVRDAWDDAVSYSGLGQSARRPMGHLQSDAGRGATGELLDAHPGQGGKCAAADPTEAHHRGHRVRGPRSDDTGAKYRNGPWRPATPTALRPSPAWTSRAAHEHGEPPAVALGHRERALADTGDRLQASLCAVEDVASSISPHTANWGESKSMSRRRFPRLC